YHAANREKDNERGRQYYHANRGRLNPVWRKRENERRKAIRESIDAAKMRPCTDCGRWYPPEAMDVDHVRGEKRFNIGSTKGRPETLPAIRAEIAKCDL